MVLNILKKKKRVSDVQLLYNTGHSPGQFRQDNNTCEIIDNNQQKHYNYPSLTWDTLKRKRRQNREYSRAKSCVVDDRGNGAGRPYERYRSSPDLSQNHYRGKDEKRKQLCKGLKETNWSTTGSLITLNFSSDEDRILKEIAYEDTEHDDAKAILSHDDSGYYCDSDSGVSSLYDTINTHNSMISIINSEEENQELEKCSQRLNKSFLQNLDPFLLHIFTRDFNRTVTSEKFSLKLDISSRLPSSPNFFLDCCCKKHLARRVIARQKELNNDSLLLTEELKTIDKNLHDLEEELKNTVSDSELKLFQRTVDQISAIVNLVFGLELRLSEGRDDPGRLCEASDLKARHDDSLHRIGGIVRDRLGVSRMITFRRLVKNKQRNICTHKCIKLELYYVQTLLNLVNLL